MGWWQVLTGAGAHPNTTVGSPNTVGPDVTPGDPHGVELADPTEPVQTRMAAVVPSPWGGWPAEWGIAWGSGGGNLDALVDTAWAALDLNSSVLSCMPVYRTRNGQILEPPSWMTNPDPTIYSSWAEFAKQLFWDFQLGEAFVLPMARSADGWPFNFRVIPPPLVAAEIKDGRRRYQLGYVDVTDEILHIRYKSRTDQARGQGPLEAGQTRIVAAGLLARYVTEFIDGGAIPKFNLVTEQKLNRAQADEVLEQWWASRMQNLGQQWKPGVLSGGVKAEPLQLNPEQLGLTDLAKWNESRIALLLGVPPFLLGLPSGGDPMTYSNVNAIFDFHDRASLHPKVFHVMTAMSNWALPRGQSVELNRDEYTRPQLPERAAAYEKLVNIGVLTPEEIRIMERFTGPVAAEALTGGGVS